MSEYRWPVKKCWIGVMQRILDERGLFKEDKLLGVIRRSGIVRAMGHFCSVEVSVCGKKYFASGAEDRIFPFHSIELEKGDKVPKLDLEFMGWCADHNTAAFKPPDEEVSTGSIVELVGTGSDLVNIRLIHRSNWPPGLGGKKKESPWEETLPGVFRKRVQDEDHLRRTDRS
jgi:hypothetical protein